MGRHTKQQIMERRARGERLQAERTRHGLSQSAMADALGIGLRAYRYVEDGVVDAPAHVFAYFCSRLQADFVRLYYGGLDIGAPVNDDGAAPAARSASISTER